MHGHLVCGFRAGTGSGGQHLVGQTGSGGLHSLLLFDLGKKRLALGFVFVLRRLDGSSQRSKLRLVTLEGVGLFPNPLDADLVDLVALGDGVDHILPLNDMAKDGVFAIKMRRSLVGDEKLAAVCPGAGIGHRENPGAAVCQRRIDFVRELVARIARAGSQRAATLDHEVGNHPVKIQPVVVRRALGIGRRAAGFRVVLGTLREADEVGDGHWGFFKLQFPKDGSLGRLELGVQAVCQFFFLLCHYGKRRQRHGCGQSALQVVVHFRHQFHGTAEGTQKRRRPQCFIRAGANLSVRD